MSRSVPDATRFTATSIHASSKPSPAPSSSSTFSPSKSPPASSQPFQRSTKPSQPLRIPRQGNLNPSPPPPSPARTETPAQKVARLRAERNAKLMAEVTLWDRIVFKGRIVADKAHYVTVLGLMVFSGASSFFESFPISPAITLFYSIFPSAPTSPPPSASLLIERPD